MSVLNPIVLTGGWDLTTFLGNATAQLEIWGGLLMVLLGVVMIIVAIWRIAKGLISHGKTQTNWFVAIALLLLGGALAGLGGGRAAWEWVSGIAKGGKQTIDDLGTTIIPMLPFIK